MTDTKYNELVIQNVDSKQLFMGLCLVLISFIMPVIFNVRNFNIFHYLALALSEHDKTDLIIASVQLVALNSIRGIPHYVGAFFVGISLRFYWRGKNLWFANAAVIVILLQIAYWGIYALHSIKYDFGIPAIVVSAFVLVFGRLDYHYLAPLKRTLQIIFFLVAFQFLDVMPALGGFPIGRGETSLDIKMAAVVLEGEALLNMIGVVGFLIFALFGVLIFFQFREENNLRQLSILQKQNQEIRTKAKLNEMENRTHQEMQHLVHDLKSPLTAMQTLVGILKMRCEGEARDKDAAYLTRIESGIMLMSRMISEILYEEQCTQIGVQVILDTILAQISITEYAPYVHASNQEPDKTICVNRFLFPRAVVNLLENAANAIPKDRQPCIHLRISSVRREDKHYTCFSVSDNGIGIPPEDQLVIWGRNVSGTHSSGLGLAFVRKVVDTLEGEIELSSIPSLGTTINILLPEGAT